MSIKWKQVGVFAAAGALLPVLSFFMLAPDEIDWVNVALVPELAENIGADLPTRLQLARLGYSALDAAKGPPGTPLQAGNFADDYGRARLESHGQRAFDLLTVEQRKKFYKLFKSRDIVPVTYNTEPNPKGSGPAVFVIEFGWEKVSSSMQSSLGATSNKLGDAWTMIPSMQVAETLVEHPSTDVSRAARRWLREHEPEHGAMRGKMAQRTDDAPALIEPAETGDGGVDTPGAASHRDEVAAALRRARALSDDQNTEQDDQAMVTDVDQAMATDVDQAMATDVDQAMATDVDQAMATDVDQEPSTQQIDYTRRAEEAFRAHNQRAEMIRSELEQRQRNQRSGARHSELSDSEAARIRGMIEPDD